jgi:hypothetical protein
MRDSPIPLGNMCVSRDGRFVATWGSDVSVVRSSYVTRVFQTDEGSPQPPQILQHASPVDLVQWNPNVVDPSDASGSAALLTLTRAGTVVLWREAVLPTAPLRLGIPALALAGVTSPLWTHEHESAASIAADSSAAWSSRDSLFAAGATATDAQSAWLHSTSPAALAEADSVYVVNSIVDQLKPRTPTAGTTAATSAVASPPFKLPRRTTASKSLHDDVDDSSTANVVETRWWQSITLTAATTSLRAPISPSVPAAATTSLVGAAWLDSVHAPLRTLPSAAGWVLTLDSVGSATIWMVSRLFSRPRATPVVIEFMHVPAACVLPPSLTLAPRPAFSLIVCPAVRGLSCYMHVSLVIILRFTLPRISAQREP